MSSLDLPDLAVRRLRVVDHGGDAMRARLSADALLSAARPGVPALAAGSILIVRRLEDPRAGGMLAGGASPSSATIRRWRAEIEGSLEHVLSAARRPARDSAPDSAPAVVFDDLAELLACLAADWATGRLRRRWWWRTWLRTRSGSADEQVSGMLEECPSHLPAVFETLAARGIAARVAGALVPDRAAAIARKVALTHSVHVSLEAGRGASQATPRPPVPPWSAAVPEAKAAELAPAQRLLLGVALTIRRAPALARTPGFGFAVARWWSAVLTGSGPPAAVMDGASVTPAAAQIRLTGPFSRLPDAPERSMPRGAPQPGETPRATGLPELATAPAPAVGGPNLARGLPEPGPTSVPLPHPHAAVRATETALAGLFYLLNVGIFLGLYGDFTTPGEPGLTLDPWDFVALLGWRLLGEETPDDPIWDVLAELAGQYLGAGFAPPRTWRISPEWLVPFEDFGGSWRRVIETGRLRVIHPAGFVAIDVPVAADARAQLWRELGRYGRPRTLPVARVRDGENPRGERVTPGRARWVGWVAGYIRARLWVALGTKTADDAVAAAVNRRGIVRVTATRIDVTFALDDLPVAIRLAGLDRSPGWIPAAGRQLEFHFV